MRILAGGRIVEPPYEIEVFFPTETPEDVCKRMAAFAPGPVFLGPGLRIRRGGTQDDPLSVLYELVIWDTITAYASILSPGRIRLFEQSVNSLEQSAGGCVIAIDEWDRPAISEHQLRQTLGFMFFAAVRQKTDLFNAGAESPVDDFTAGTTEAGDFKCAPSGQGTSSVMVMNGTKDPINPFDGGEVKLFGLLKCSKIRPSRESGQYLADLNDSTAMPETSETQVSDGFYVEQVIWCNKSKIEVELVAIHGGGHGIPQPYWRYPRLLGPAPKELNGPAIIWAFFERQRPESGLDDSAEKSRLATRTLTIESAFAGSSTSVSAGAAQCCRQPRG